MPDNPRMIYWDSRLFLLYIEGSPEWMPVLDSILDDASTTGSITIVTSTVSIVEVAFAATERAGGLLDDAIVAAIDDLWADRSAVQLVEFDQVVAREARKLLRRSIELGRSLKPMDAIHLATAALMQASDFQTTDDRLQNWTDLDYPVRDPWTETPRLGI